MTRVFDNVGGFFSDYFIGSLLERQLRGKLGENTLRSGERRCRAQWERTGRIGPGASLHQTRTHWLRPLFAILGYELADAPEIEAGRDTLTADFAHLVDGRPVALLYLRGWDDDPDRPAGRRRDTLHQQMEAMLAGGEARWGLIATGQRLRLVRRGVSAGGLSYFEIDFEALFDAPDPHAFATFWALFRAAALAPDADKDGHSLLDLVEQGSRQYALGVGEDLKEAVFEAVRVAAQGFLGTALTALTPRPPLPDAGEGEPSLDQIFHDTLTLMYRLLFVLYAESRGLLPLGHPVYRDSYSLESLRNDVAAPDAVFSEGGRGLWQRLQALFALIQRGCRAGDFVVPAFYGALFDDDAAPTLRASALSDATVARIIDLLSMTSGRKGVGRQRVSYRELGVEQLGSVYEGLLEFEPRLASETMVQVAYKGDLYVVPRREWRDEYKIVAEIPAGQFYLSPGAGRKSTGSYYTRASLVNFIVERTLAPLVEGKTSEGILELKVLDPAMGSGAFLVGACRYLAAAYGRALAHEQAVAMRRLQEARTKGQLPPELARDIADALAGTGVPLAPDVAAAAEDPHPRTALTPRPPLPDAGEGGRAAAVEEDAVRDGDPLTPLPPSPASGRGAGGEGLDAPSPPEGEGVGGEGAAAPEHMRLVAERCLYGVDLNPMAVELARVSLWLATMAGDKPLTFLDHHLKRGNSLIGARLADLDRAPMPAKATGKKGQDTGLQGRLFDEADLRASLDQVVDRRYILASDPTDTVQDAINKARLLKDLDRDVPGWGALREACDLWCAAWFWPDDPRTTEKLPMSPAVYGSVARHIKEPAHAMAPRNVDDYRALARGTAERQGFFHWELEFPEVYYDARGLPRAGAGFDGVIGNPPWDIVKPNSQEFFAAFDPRFRELGKQAALKRSRELLAAPEVASRWGEYEFGLERQSTFYRAAEQYSAQTALVDGARTGGDINTYKLFLERFRRLLAPGGHAGIIVPSGLYTDEGCTGLRELFFERSRVDYLYGFENRAKVFPIDSRFKFVLLGVAPGRPAGAFPAAFMLHDPDVLANVEERALRVPQETIRRFSPGTLSLLEFRSQRDVEIIEKVFARAPLLGDDVPGAWSARFAREFDMTNDSGLFNEDGAGLPLYEGKTVHQYDAYWSRPGLWVREGPAREELGRRELGRMKRAVARHREEQGLPPLKGVAADLFEARLRRGVRLACEEYRFVYRRIARNTDERTLISAIIPRRVFSGEAGPYVVPLDFLPERALAAQDSEQIDFYTQTLTPAQMLYLCGLFNSFVLDYVIRFKVSANLNFFYVYGLPVPRLCAGDPYFDAIMPRAARLICTTAEFDDLARAVGMAPGTGATGPAERQGLKAEIDALVARLYGLDEGDLAHILYADYTFPLVDKGVKDGVMAAFARVGALTP